MIYFLAWCFLFAAVTAITALVAKDRELLELRRAFWAEVEAHKINRMRADQAHEDLAAVREELRNERSMRDMKKAGGAYR